jgi:hypothetical protein
MKYLISERQFNLLTEIGRQPGHLDWIPLNSFYSYMNRKISRKTKSKLFKKFFEKIFDREIEEDEFFRDDVQEFFESPETSQWKEEFLTKDAISGFAYFVAKNYFGLEEGFGLNYIVKVGTELRDDGEVYYFFDPQLKIFIGYIIIYPLEEHYEGFYKVGLSAVDENLIGTGYGIKMYQNVLTNVDYLMSDDNLYSGSYRIWKHTLPKYANVWGLTETPKGSNLKRIIPGKKVRTEKFDNFIASIKHSEIEV